MPVVHQIRKVGNFALYEILTNSDMKKIAIQLTSFDKTILRDGVFSFAPRIISLSLNLSYDFVKCKKVEINMLEGLLAACILEGEDLVDEIIQLNGRKQFKTDIINKNLGIDE